MMLMLKLFMCVLQLVIINCEVYSTLLGCSNKVLTSQYTYRQVDVRSKVECAMVCNVDDKCKSFQYGSKKCNMNNVKDDGSCSLMVDDLSTKYYQTKGAICLNGGIMISSVCNCFNGYVGTYCERLMYDCSEGYSSPHGYITNVYFIHPLTSPTPFQVKCIMKSGGRTVFQYHTSSSFSFNTTMQDYIDGFGDLNGNHWLGLEKMHLITTNGQFQVVVYMKLANSTYYQQYYKDFLVSGMSDFYKMNFSSTVPHSVTALGDSLSDLRGMAFSAYDSDNDNSLSSNCALKMGSGWWFNSCSSCNPNGKLLLPADSIKTTNYEVFWTNDLQNIVPVKTLMWFTYHF